jgi:hypothetical protein
MSIVEVTPTFNNIDVSKYVDLNYTGYQFSPTLSSASPYILKGIAAIKNVIKLYIMSNVGDYGRNLTKGGPMVKFLGKSITDIREDELKDALTKAISIYSNIVVFNIVVERDTIGRGWIITINFYDTYNKFVDSTQFSIG